MVENVDIKIGRRTYNLSAETEHDKKNLLNASAMLNNYAEQFLKANPNMSNDEMLMLSAISMAHEYGDLKKEKASEEQMLEKMHNSLAERLENLIK